MVSEDSTSRVIVLPVTKETYQYDRVAKATAAKYLRVLTKICMIAAAVLLDECDCRDEEEETSYM